MNLNRIIDINYARCFKVLKEKFRFIILCVMVSLCIGILLSVFAVDTKNKYKANATVYSITYGSYTASEQGTYAIKTYADIIKSYRVAERAALLIGDNALTKELIYDMISVDTGVITGTTYVYKEDSSIITIHAESNSIDQSIKVVNAVADAFVLEVNGLSEIESTQVLDYAHVAEKSYFALVEQIKCILILVLAGLFLSCMIIVGGVVFSPKIISVKDATLYGQIEIIGVLPRFKNT